VVVVAAATVVDWWRKRQRNLYHHLCFCPEEVDSRFLENVGNHVCDYIVSNPGNHSLNFYAVETVNLT